MTAGLPGVGLAGLFYLVCALAMPFVELGRTLAGRGSRARRRLVAEQFLLACAVLASFALTGRLLAEALPTRAEQRVQQVAQTAGDGAGALPAWSPLATTGSVLVVLLAVVVVGGAVAARREARREVAGSRS